MSTVPSRLGQVEGDCGTFVHAQDHRPHLRTTPVRSRPRSIEPGLGGRFCRALVVVGPMAEAVAGHRPTGKRGPHLKRCARRVLATSGGPARPKHRRPCCPTS
jgi:hypothetical protein